MSELRQREAGYCTKYGLDYPTFAQRTATDKDFVRRVETQVGNHSELLARDGLYGQLYRRQLELTAVE